MKVISLKVTYQEYLVILQGLKCYADKCFVLADDLREIVNNKDICPGVKERLEREIRQLNNGRTAALHLDYNLNDQAEKALEVPDYIQESFEDPEEND